MDTDEILSQLTAEQKKELYADLAAFAQNAAPDYKKDPVKYATLSTAVHLKGNNYLSVTISLHPGDKDILHPVIENIEQLASLDAYLEVINGRPGTKK